MSDSAKAKIATELFNKGSQAVQAGKFDYAVDCFLKCCRLVPDKLTFRQYLRVAEHKLYKDNKTGAGMLGKAKMQGPKMKLKAAKARKKWHDVIVCAEDALQYNPWDASLLYEVGNACNQLELFDVGISVMETAVGADKKSADAYRLLAELYEKGSQYDKAINALAMVVKLDPADHETASKMRQLAASSTIQRGKYEDDEEDGGPNIQRAGADEEFGDEDSGGADTYEDRLRKDIAKLEAKLEENPGNTSICVEIAENCRKLEDFDKAVRFYKMGLDGSGGGDPDIKMQWLDCQIDPLRKNFEVIKSRMASFDKSVPDAAEKVKKLKAQYNAFSKEIVKREVELFGFKVQVKPDDYPSHIELGTRYLQLQQFDDSIKSLQTGRNDNRRKWEACLGLGRAFWYKKNYALAEKNLGDAMEAVSKGNEDAKKDILYWQGRVAEDRKKTTEAIDFYNEIAAIDYGYRDVAARLDRLNAEQDD